MKTIQLEIPDGKEAKWVDGVLTLVDEQPKDITERIKTFEDAYQWCEENAEVDLVNHYDDWEIYNDTTKDIIAYLKLRIITAALNEGWVPTFEEGEVRWFVVWDNADMKWDRDGECIFSTMPPQILFKSAGLAEYAANQFADIYADFYGTPKGGQQ